ncbi:hypothetical protein [Streptomyces sp. NPDC056296]|uniref:hypothetical protein n=1 Tax=Streptomyces sp. NPDC056296 TaxID=3345775 RepID=UPI0035E04CF4
MLDPDVLGRDHHAVLSGFEQQLVKRLPEVRAGRDALERTRFELQLPHERWSIPLHPGLALEYAQ